MNAGYVRLSRDDDHKNYVSIENQTLINTQPIMVPSLIAGTKTMVFPAISLTVRVFSR